MWILARVSYLFVIWSLLFVNNLTGSDDEARAPSPGGHTERHTVLEVPWEAKNSQSGLLPLGKAQSKALDANANGDANT